MKQILLLSDTHNQLDKRYIPYFKEADEIWHAGDIGSLSIIEELEKYATVRAVYGNIDNHTVRSEFKSILVFQCEKVKVLIIHIGGYPNKYTKNSLDLIKNIKPNLFICGHSHILKVIYDKQNKLLHMNPGAIGNYGIHKVKTALSFLIENEKIQNLRIIEFPRSK
tara:strand:+ start:997 stop:1494 length:498 start_codon:yes stop_codon:yes gene_type:complete